MGKVIVTFFKGKMLVEAEGYSGPECTEKTKLITDLVSAKTYDEELKPEYYEEQREEITETQ